MEPKVDVRIIKTKNRLKASLLEILKEKSIDQITISEICSRAPVNRNTFYSHYQSVKDLLDEVEAQFLESILSKIHVNSETTESVSGLLTNILSCVYESKEMSQLLFTENGDKDVLKTLVMFALPSAVKNWAVELNISEDMATKLYYFVIGGAVNIIEQWVINGFKETPAELAEILNMFIMKGQSAFSN